MLFFFGGSGRVVRQRPPFSLHGTCVQFSCSCIGFAGWLEGNLLIDVLLNSDWHLRRLFVLYINNRFAFFHSYPSLEPYPQAPRPPGPQA